MISLVNDPLTQISLLLCSGAKMDLPPELLEDVAQRLSRRDLKQLRLTCKRLAQYLVPYLFDSLFLSTDPVDHETAESAMAHFGPYIKTIVVTPLGFPYLSRESYKWRARSEINCVRLPYRSRFDQHVDMGYRAYRRVQGASDQSHILSQLWLLFQQAIVTLPGVRRIVITYRRRAVHLTDTELASYCRWKTCSIPRAAHAAFRLCPLFDDASPNIMRCISGILSARATNVKELIMEPRNSGPTSWLTHYFTIDGEGLRKLTKGTSQASGFLANLSKLRLAVHEHRFVGNLSRTGIIAEVLSQAQNLECLFLEKHFYDDWMDADQGQSVFRLMLGGCDLPKLRVLVLEDTNLEGDELLSFLRNSPGMSHLVLETCKLKAYLWKTLIDRIKNETKLRTLHMNELSGGFEVAGLIKKWQTYVDYDGEVEKYLLSCGPNPFSFKTLIHYDHDYSCGVFETYPQPRKAQEYYDLYF